MCVCVCVCVCVREEGPTSKAKCERRGKAYEKV